MKIAEYQELKEKIDEMRREADRAAGALEQTLARIKQEHKCNDINQARARLKQLEATAAKAQIEFDAKLAQFEKKWSHVLN